MFDALGVAKGTDGKTDGDRVDVSLTVKETDKPGTAGCDSLSDDVIGSVLGFRVGVMDDDADTLGLSLGDSDDDAVMLAVGLSVGVVDAEDDRDDETLLLSVADALCEREVEAVRLVVLDEVGVTVAERVGVPDAVILAVAVAL